MRAFTIATRLVALAFIASAVWACTSARTPLASGSVSGGGWAMSTFRKDGEGVCLEIAGGGQATSSICGLTADDGVLWRPDAPAGSESFAAGVIGRPDGMSVRATLDDGSTLASNAYAANAVSDVRFYVFVLPPDTGLAQLEILDALGAVVETRAAD
jgi:hypothetical protein